MRLILSGALVFGAYKAMIHFGHKQNSDIINKLYQANIEKIKKYELSGD